MPVSTPTEPAASCYTPRRPRRLRRAHAFFTVFIFFLFALGAFGFILFDKQRSIDDSFSDLQRLSRAISAHTAQLVLSVDHCLTGVAKDFQSIDPAQWAARPNHEALRAFASGLPHINALYLINERGLLVNTSQTFPVAAIDVRDREYFSLQKGSEDSKLRIGRPFRSRINSEWIIDLSRPIRDQNGRFLGVALASISPQYFVNLFSELAPSPGSAISLLREDGALLSRFPSLEAALGRSQAGRSVLFSESGHGLMEDRFIGPGAIDPSQRLVVYRRAPDCPLLISVSTPLAEVTQRWRSVAGMLVAGACLTCLAVGVFSYLLSRQFRRSEADAERVRRSEAHLVRAQNVANFGSWEWEYGADKLSISPQAAMILGLPVESARIPYDDFLNTLHPEDRDLADEKIRNALSSGEAFRIQHRVTRKGRSPLVVVEEGEILCDEAGAPKTLTVIVQDISERVLAEVEYSTIIQTALDGYWMCEAKTGRLLDVNDAYCRLVGYTREELLTMSCCDLSGSDLDACPIKAAAKTRYARFEAQHFCKDGRTIDVDISARRLDIKNGVLVVFIRDVTERKVREAALLASEEQLTRIFQHSPQLIVITTRDQDRFVEVNRAFCAILGYAREEILGRSAAELGVWPETPSLARWFEASAIEGKIENAELLFKRKNGETLLGLCSIAPVELASGPCLLSQAMDISERKALEWELLRARDDAEAATRAKSAFLANMSHEIRTPMNAIMGLCHLLQQTALDLKQKDYADKIQRSSGSLLGLLNDILDFSKVEAQKLTMEFAPFDLEEVLETLAASTSGMAAEKKLELVFSLSPTAPTALVGDPLRLGQVLMNLTGNALKFTPAGKVVVRAECNGVVETAEGLESSWMFLVRDTGLGVSKEMLGELFQPFSQADDSMTRRYGGTGLGLAISKKLAELMGGEIAVSSEVGRGSVFGFSARFRVQAPAASNAPSLDDLSGLRALVADADIDAREALAEILTARSCSTCVCGSTEELLSALDLSPDTDARAFDLVWIASNLNSGLGLEALRLAKAKAPALALIYVAPGDTPEAFAAGARALLRKPALRRRALDAALIALNKSPLPSAPPNNAQQRVFENTRVLVAEDNLVNQMVVSEILASVGLHATLVSDGAQALEKAFQEPFDAVLMDIQMPGMDGFETTRRLKERLKDAAPPVIAMTAHAMSGDREKCLAAGMDDYLAKPIDPNELFSILARWIDPTKTRLLETPVNASTPSQEEGLPRLEGLDASKALKQLGGGATALRRLLLRFREDYADTTPRLCSALDRVDLAELLRLAHSLKGAAGAIAAQDLYVLASELETQVQQAAVGSLDESVSALGEELGRVLNSLAPLDAPLAESASPTPRSSAESSTLIHELRTALRENLYIDANRLAELKERFPDYEERFAELERRTAAFQYEQALEILDELFGA